ncbi:MAG: DNA translocase FtsK 4TM domain-containing protein [Patescibacteria group bacterium]
MKKGGKQARSPSGTARALGIMLRRVFSFEYIPHHIRQGIGIMFLFVLAGLSALSLFGLAGRFGEWIAEGLSVLFGFTKYLFPFIVCALALTQFSHDSKEESVHPLIYATSVVFFLLSFTAFWHLHFPIEQSWQAALEGQGGGVAGYFLSYSLSNIIGFWGALLVLSALFISSCLILLNTSLKNFFVQIREVCSGIVQQLQTRRIPTQASIRFDPLHNEEEDQEELIEFSKKQTPLEEEKEQIRIPAVHQEEHGEKMEVRKLPKKKIPIHLSLDLLSNKVLQPTSGDVKANRLVIQKTLENFGIPVEMGEVNVGPTVTQFTFKPAEGIKLSSITGLHNDLALALAAHPIRIEAPIPGKALVGIEVPNQRVALVTLRQLLESDEFKARKSSMMVALGKDVSGASRVAHLASMPHLLIAGSTGSGKTVCINAIIMSLLFQNGPDDLRFIMIDPKRVELPCYNNIPHLLTPVITDVKKTINALKWTIGEMERRFDTLSKASKRDIGSYNKTTEEKLPYIVVVIDELADIMVTSGPEAENLIIRLAQMARAVGIHLILATQRPSVDVITGLIKANITSRIAFAVASQMDSRTILDTSGAEKLIGRGDMLYISSDLSRPVRLQGAYVSDDEIERVVAALKEQGEPTYEEGVTERNGSGSFGNGSDDDDDELLGEATEIIMQAHKASASLLQRRLRIGYARAARILDLLEAKGIIGPGDGAKPREVLVRDLDDVDIRSTSPLTHQNGNPLDEDEEIT